MSDGNLLRADWLGACRRMVEAQRELFARDRTIAERTVHEGRGEGGDEALAIDRRAEDIVFAELDALHAAGHEFTAISEERGQVEFGDGSDPHRIVIDPIDGSLNARRTIPSFALSLAVARGETMEDVEFGYVYDFGAHEEFSARRGEGARLRDEPLRAIGPGLGLEVVGIEAAKPERIIGMLEQLEGRAQRIRALGSIAIMLCWVAGGRLDGMLTGRACRSVDVAAAQLVAREAGALVDFPGFELNETSLSLGERYHVTAGTDSEKLETLREVQAFADPAPQPS